MDDNQQIKDEQRQNRNLSFFRRLIVLALLWISLILFQRIYTLFNYCKEHWGYFSNSLSMAPHVVAVCKSSFFHLPNIFKIRKFLSFHSAETLVHAFITSKVNYCNSLLYGQPKCVLQDLKRVLNCSARLI